MARVTVDSLAKQCGFELAGVTPAVPLSEADVFLEWVARGRAGRMSYLADRRAHVRTDPRLILPSARSVICLGKLYNAGGPSDPAISRYAQARDYHETLRIRCEQLVELLRAEFGPAEYRICVDTAPLLERSYARAAGLGWIGRNTCLINQELGSWVFLAEVLTSLDLTPGVLAPDRCGTCVRCIDACPTDAIVPGGLRTELDATRCISYLTIESRGALEADDRPLLGGHVFGCDICQDVCPWNRRSPVTADPESQPVVAAADLEQFASMTAEDFRAKFRSTPVWRAKYSDFLRNVAVAMGNSGDPKYLPALRNLAGWEDEVVRSHAEWGIAKLEQCSPSPAL